MAGSKHGQSQRGCKGTTKETAIRKTTATDECYHSKEFTGRLLPVLLEGEKKKKKKALCPQLLIMCTCAFQLIQAMVDACGSKFKGMYVIRVPSMTIPQLHCCRTHVKKTAFTDTVVMFLACCCMNTVQMATLKFAEDIEAVAVADVRSATMCTMYPITMDCCAGGNNSTESV